MNVDYEKSWLERKISIDPKTDCWNWKGMRNIKGYGIIDWVVNGRRQTIRAHRRSFQVYKGEIPGGLFVRHTCDNSSCINPDHLLTGTHQDNMDDMEVRGRRAVGINCNNSKLTTEDVVQIRQLAGTKTQGELAIMFNVNRRTIGNVQRRVTRNLT